MIWTRTRTLIAGIVLIVAANAVSLICVAYNRSAPPDSVLRLSQRELQIPYGWRVGTENTGVAFDLRWQVLTKNDEDTGTYNYGRGDGPAWLDEAKLATLGFDVPAERKTVHRRQLAKEVLLVLEFDGPARQQTLERLRRKLAKEQNMLAANLGIKEFENRVKWAANHLENEENKNSRLYVIDAGYDRDAMRARYSDRSRFVIVRGKVQPRLIKHKNEEILIGYISGLNVNRINVPLEHQQVIGSMQPRDSREANQRSYAFDVAFGKRLEPWIVNDNRTQQAKGVANTPSKVSE